MRSSAEGALRRCFSAEGEEEAKSVAIRSDGVGASLLLPE